MADPLSATWPRQTTYARHLDHETGALRYALAEDQDPARVALTLTRRTRAVVATSRERREIAREATERRDRRDRASWPNLVLPDPESHESSA